MRRVCQNAPPTGSARLGATIAAENGATVHQLMAIFDWKTPGQAKVYTDAVDRKRMGGRGHGAVVSGTKWERKLSHRRPLRCRT